ncbi:MAG: hypothetical protein ACFE85_01900 [Candidatus Hodarchaeota archaeon]
MSSVNGNILFDSVKEIKSEGIFKGSIITKCNDDYKSVIFSDNMRITNSEGVYITEGLNVGFKLIGNKMSAFSKKGDFYWKDNISSLEYSVLIPEDIMKVYDEGQFGDAFPFTLNLLHTAGLYLSNYEYGINHLDFFKGEILKNPVSLIMNGIIVADRVVIDHRGDPVFYDCLIVGRDQKEDLSVSYEPLTNVKKSLANVEYIIILGIEELK